MKFNLNIETPPQPAVGVDLNAPSQGWNAEYEHRKEEAVKKIMQKNTGDYYSILGLPTDCSAEDVKRAFLKLSLLVHPDKNKSPDATEAFKRVLEACDRLKKLKLSDQENHIDHSGNRPSPNGDNPRPRPDYHSGHRPSPNSRPDYHSGNRPSPNGENPRSRSDYHSGYRPSPNGENPKSRSEAASKRRRTPQEGGWGRQCCVVCGESGGNKNGIYGRQYYCSLNCLRKFLDSKGGK